MGTHTLSNSDDWKLNQYDCSMYQVSQNGYLTDDSVGCIDMDLCEIELFDRVNNYYGYTNDEKTL